MTPKHEFELDVKLDVEARVRQSVKGVLEEVLEEERKEHGSKRDRPKTTLPKNRSTNGPKGR